MSDADSYESQPSITRRERRQELRAACAIVHGIAAGKMSVNDLIRVILEEGLPPRAEREKIRAAKLSGGDSTA